MQLNTVNLEYKKIVNQEMLMYIKLDRPRRTNLVSQGLIYMGGEEHKITIKNISINGVLAQLNSNREDIDIKYIFNQLQISTIVDLYLPEMRLAGEVEVVRADMDEGHILLAMAFKNIAYEMDKDFNRRKAYRKYMIDPGKILLNGQHHNFTTVNVSVEGLMISLSEAISAKVGTMTRFEFKRLMLQGKTKVIWIYPLSDDQTLIGLQFINIEKNAIRGIPRFADQQKG